MKGRFVSHICYYRHGWFDGFYRRSFKSKERCIAYINFKMNVWIKFHKDCRSYVYPGNDRMFYSVKLYDKKDDSCMMSVYGAYEEKEEKK